MADYYLAQMLAWYDQLVGRELFYAFLYGAVSAGVVTGSYAALAALKKRSRQSMMQARPYRYFRLRLGR